MDLESGFNKSCVGEKAVINNDLSKLKLASPTLLSIKNGKIEKSYTTKEDIIKTLTSNQNSLYYSFFYLITDKFI